LLINPTITAIIRKIYVALPVVKKLPVVLIGKISTKNNIAKGIIKF
jgi:hypothetical protein